MSGCATCEPAKIEPLADCWIYLWPASGHTRPKLAKLAADLGVPSEDMASDCLRWRAAAAALDGVLTAAGQVLLPEERDGTKGLILAAGTEPGISDFRRVVSLERMIGMQTNRWLSDVLSDNRLETHFQPIIKAQAPDRMVAYECLLRGRDPDGALIPPGKLFAAAKNAGLLFQLDLAARRSAVRAIAKQESEAFALINFTPTSIYDPATCLKSTVGLIKEVGVDPSRIVFEIIETEHADEALLRSILDVYRSAGFRIAVDDFGAGYSSMNLVIALRPDFLKLDMELIRGIDADPYKAELAARLLDAARSLSITTIAEGVETEAEWEWVRRHGADLVQGYYFARPGTPMPTLVG